MTQHNFEVVSGAAVRASVPENMEEDSDGDLDISKIIDVPELIGDAAHKSVVSIKTKQIAHFVVMCKATGASYNPGWVVPSQADFDLFNCYLEATISTAETSRFTRVYKWGNTAVGVGLLGLHTRDLELLQEFRLLISQLVYLGRQWTTFPKAAVLKKYSVTTMLRDDLVTFPLARLPFAIFNRNPSLDGNLTVIKSKIFSEKNTTKAGQSMRCLLYTSDAADE